MSMSTHVVGFRPPDDKYQRMRAVYEACTAAGTSTPREVLEFFEGEEPSENGTIVEIKSYPYKGDMCEGLEVDITDLPRGVKVIRFYNAW